MSWTISPGGGGGGDYERPPVGNHAAVLVAMVDLGTHRERYKDQPERDARKIYWVWELVAKRKSGSSENHVIAIDLTLSGSDRSRMGQFVAARLGRPFQPDYKVIEELGKPCMLNVKENDKGYPKVAGVAPVPDGLPFPAPQHKPFALSLDDYRKAGWSLDAVPGWLPWLYRDEIPTVIRRSKEYMTEVVAAHQAKQAAQQAEEFFGQPAGGGGKPIPF